MRWFKRLPMQRKLLFAFLGFVVVLTILFGFMVGHTANQQGAYYQSMLTQANDIISKRIDMAMEDLRYTSTMYLMNTDILSYIENDFYIGQAQYIDALRALKTNTLSAKINPNLSSVTYLTHSGEVYSSAGYNEEYLKGLKQLTQKMEDTGEKFYITPAYRTTLNQQQVDTITYAHLLSNPYNFKPIGYAFLNLDMKSFSQHFKVLTFPFSQGALGVQNGKVFFADNGTQDEFKNLLIAQVEGHRQQLLQKGEAIFTLQGQGERYLCVAAWNNTLNMAIVNHAPLSLVNRQVYQSIQFYIIALILATLLFVAGSIVLSNVFAKPIQILHDGMNKVKKGELVPITQQTQRLDDMGELIRGFNNMIGELNSSILREYESRDLQRRAQIEMLQSQINPHFLYNALNLISSIAVMEDVPQISDIAGDLADLFRYNISSGVIVPLAEELRQAKRYIAIQTSCMGGEIKVVYEIAPEAESFKVLKFLLQPLVENSFIHGFGKRSLGGALTIRACMNGEKLCLEVGDDGLGIPEEKRRALLDYCSRDLPSYQKGAFQNNLGLSNVIFRLRAFYGSDCEIAIKSEEGKGTLISMLIPVYLKKEEGW